MENVAKFNKIVYTFDIIIKKRYAHLSNTTIPMSYTGVENHINRLLSFFE